MPRKLISAVLSLLAVVTVAAATAPVVDGTLPARQVFPATNWWNQDISSAPVDANSAHYISLIGGSTALHPDFGTPPYGLPYVVVGGDQPHVPVTFQWPDESDAGAPGQPSGYPIPDQAKTGSNYIENGSDGHMILVDKDNWLLYELYQAQWNGSSWQAGSGAIFDMSTNNRRPDGWTSADAAGLAIFPGLVRYDEAYGTSEITHAFRMTVSQSNGYVWPASHAEGSTPGASPMGMRLRLKASKNLSGFPPEMQRIFRAMQRYGLIVADGGSDMFITGTADPRWNNSTLTSAFGGLTANDFDVIQLGWKGSTTAAPRPPTNVRIIK